jgi:hypothetical protein
MSSPQTLLQKADIAVFSANNSLQLIIEIATKKNTASDWAMTRRQDLFAHKGLPNSPFFMLVLPDRIYLWVNANQDLQQKPDYQLETTAVLGTSLAADLPSISEYGLAIITRSWLNMLTVADLSVADFEPDKLWLFESGLYNAIKRGSVASDTYL